MGKRARSTTRPANSVEHEGKFYATLDFTSPHETKKGTQSRYLCIPHGWSLADFSDGVVEKVIHSYTWGTDVVVLSNGDGYGAAGYSDRMFGSGLLLHTGTAPGQLKYKPRDSNIRILICADPPVERNHRHCHMAMSSMWLKQQFTDCEVVCKGHVFKCHRAVLAQASPVFEQMFSGAMLEAKAQRVEIEAADSDAVAALLEYVYTGSFDCSNEHVPGMVKLADFYQLDCLTGEACKEMLEVLDKNNVVAVVRTLRDICERPHIATHWAQLGSKIKASEELTFALMAGT